MKTTIMGYMGVYREYLGLSVLGLARKTGIYYIPSSLLTTRQEKLLGFPSIGIVRGLYRVYVRVIQD